MCGDVNAFARVHPLVAPLPLPLRLILNPQSKRNSLRKPKAMQPRHNIMHLKHLTV